MGKMQMVELDPVKMQTFMNQTDARALDLALGKAPGYLVKTKQRCKMPAGVYRLLCKLAELQPDALTPDPEPERTADDPLPGQMEIEQEKAFRVVHEISGMTHYFDMLYGNNNAFSISFPCHHIDDLSADIHDAFDYLASAIMEAAQP